MTLAKIQLLRQAFDLSYADMGRALHISANAYGKVERGETALTLQRIKQIAAVFGVNHQHLDDDNYCLLFKEKVKGKWLVELVSCKSESDKTTHEKLDALLEMFRWIEQFVMVFLRKKKK